MGNYIGKIEGLQKPIIVNKTFTMEEQLRNIYKEKTQNEFEYRLNLYCHQTCTNFWQELREIINECGDKYNYKQIMKEKGK